MGCRLDTGDGLWSWLGAIYQWEFLQGHTRNNSSSRSLLNAVVRPWKAVGDPSQFAGAHQWFLALKPSAELVERPDLLQDNLIKILLRSFLFKKKLLFPSWKSFQERFLSSVFFQKIFFKRFFAPQTCFEEELFSMFCWLGWISGNEEAVLLLFSEEELLLLKTSEVKRRRAQLVLHSREALDWSGPEQAPEIDGFQLKVPNRPISAVAAGDAHKTFAE